MLVCRSEIFGAAHASDLADQRTGHGLTLILWTLEERSLDDLRPLGRRFGSTKMIARRTAALLGTGQLIAGLLLLPGWLIVDLDDSWELVPEQVPQALLLAIDRGIGPWELPGVGIFLILAWISSTVGLGAAARSERPVWLLVSGLSSVAAGILGLITVAVLVVASVAIGAFLPPDWDAFAPEVRVGWAAYAFSVGSCINAAAALIVWVRCRRAHPIAADQHDGYTASMD